MPRVSVITATAGRHDLLRRAIASLARQTYRDFEHVVISDGPDPALPAVLAGHPCTLTELGRNWHAISGGVNRGGKPKQIGVNLARGELVAYLDDDNEYLPGHLETLVAAMDADPRPGFAFSRMERFRGGARIDTIGGPRPVLGQIDTNLLMHRWELIHVANWRGGIGSIYEDDAELVAAWIKAGTTWKHVPRVTVRYHVTH